VIHTGDNSDLLLETHNNEIKENVSVRSRSAHVRVNSTTSTLATEAQSDISSKKSSKGMVCTNISHGSHTLFNIEKFKMRLHSQCQKKIDSLRRIIEHEQSARKYEKRLKWNHPDMLPLHQLLEILENCLAPQSEESDQNRVEGTFQNFVSKERLIWSLVATIKNCCSVSPKSPKLTPKTIDIPTDPIIDNNANLKQEPQKDNLGDQYQGQTNLGSFSLIDYKLTKRKRPINSGPPKTNTTLEALHLPKSSSFARYMVHRDIEKFDEELVPKEKELIMKKIPIMEARIVTSPYSHSTTSSKKKLSKPGSISSKPMKSVNSLHSHLPKSNIFLSSSKIHLK
jgi:hypothetical protein